MINTAEVTEHCLSLRIPGINQLKSIWSPEMSIHGIRWNVILRKETDDNDKASLGVHLHCAKDVSSNWSLAGSASFKLLPFSKDINPLEYHISPTVFDSSHNTVGESEFISWNDLFDGAKHYVKNDAIQLQINVTAEDPNDPNRSRLNFDCIGKCCEIGSLAIFRQSVTNIENLMAVRSPKFTLRGLPWVLQISRDRLSYVGVSLDLGENIENISYKMTMSIKLMSSKNGVRPIEKCDTAEHKCTMELNVVKVMSWDELLKPENGFVNNDCITFEIELNAGKPGDGVNGIQIAKQAERMCHLLQMYPS